MKIDKHSARRTLALVIFGIFSLISNAAFSQENNALEKLLRVPALSIADGLKAFELVEEFEIQLVAAEPDVLEPVAICYDENGLLYVAEYLKFPTIKGKSDRGDGRIRLLKDTDNDGRYESSHVFAEGLAWPTGICPWRGGIFVIAAPDLWYLKDTDGDHRADIRKKWYTGFGFSNEEGTANNLIWGVDHWIYGAGSNSGGHIVRAGDPNSKSVDIRGCDFRFHPVTGEFQALSGAEQFGNSFDDWFNRFICQNSKPAVHVVLPRRYLARNPFLSVPNVRRDIWKGNRVFRLSRPEPWRIARTRIRESMQKKWSPPFVRHDVFTATSGATIYRGDAYPRQFHGNLFVGDVQSNLIHRRVMKPAGVSFNSLRLDKGIEVVRSSDNWFRPVNLHNAPDGTLHVVDMYREIIETPDSLPTEILKQVDLNSGHDRGRIYRLAPKGFKPSEPPALASATIQQLVQQLKSRNGWRRDTAQRLIFERNDRSAIEPLRLVLKNSESTQAKLHAMYALAGLEALGTETLIKASLGPSNRIREHAIRLAESVMADSDELLDAILKNSHSTDPRVRFQVALSLGELARETARRAPIIHALFSILQRDCDDRWIRTAVLSSSLHVADLLLIACLDDKKMLNSNAARQLFRQLAVTVGAACDQGQIQSTLQRVEITTADHVGIRRELVIGIAEGLKASGKSFRRFAANSPSANKLLRSAIDQAKKTSTSSTTNLEVRIAATELMSHAEFGDVETVLNSLLDPRQPHSLQIAAIKTLSTFDLPVAAKRIIGSWNQLSPAVRAEALEALLSRRESTKQFLDSVIAGRIPVAHIEPMRRKQLVDHSSRSIAMLSRRLFAGSDLSPRKKVLEKYAESLRQKGDLLRGRKIFEQHCATCHRLHGKGHNVGPDLATVQTKSHQELLVQILDPNREIQSNYLGYVVTLNDGRQVSGMIINETPTSITLQRGESVRQTILRSTIEEIDSTGVSLMPEGLEQKINTKQMADLLDYLKRSRK